MPLECLCEAVELTGSHDAGACDPIVKKDLVDRQLLQICKPYALEPAPEITLVDLLDHGPVHSEVLRNVLDRHVAQQGSRVPLKRSRVAVLSVGEGHADLPDYPALPALDPGDRESDPHLARADRQTSELTCAAAAPDRVPAPSRRAPNGFRRLRDREVNRAVTVLSPLVEVAANAKLSTHARNPPAVRQPAARPHFSQRESAWGAGPRFRPSQATPPCRPPRP